MCDESSEAKGSCLTVGDGEGGGAKREDYTEEDVEYYFNYSGILAERGSYDTLEELIKCELHIPERAPALLLVCTLCRLSIAHALLLVCTFCKLSITHALPLVCTFCRHNACHSMYGYICL